MSIKEKFQQFDELRAKRGVLQDELQIVERQIKELADELVLELRKDHPPTEREWQVIRLVRERKSDKEIAAILNISYRTAKYHVSHLIHKAGVKRRHEL